MVKGSSAVRAEIGKVLSSSGKSSNFYLRGYCGNFIAGLRYRLGYGTPLVVEDKKTGVELHVVLDIGRGWVADAGGVLRRKDLVRKRGELIKAIKESHGLDPTLEVAVRPTSWSGIRGTVGYVPMKEYYDRLVIEEGE